jgi:hypothetical protein
LKVLEAQKIHFVKDHIKYLYTINNLCGILESIGESEKAIKGYLKALNISKV